MNIQYFNNQNKRDPMNGKLISDGRNLAALLTERRNDAPFIATLRGENDFQLICGIGFDSCCVEHERIDGDIPYLMAVSPNRRMEGGYVEFLIANTPTPFAARYIITFDELKEIALHFLETGGRSAKVFWHVLDPHAIVEDAKCLTDRR